MGKTYTTIQGDTWDIISYNVYGDENYINILMENNYDLLDTFIFPAGVVVNIPEINDSPKVDDLPAWRV